MFWAKKIKILLGFGAEGPKPKENFFFAQNMLRLSGQAAQELQEAQKLHAQLLVFYCIKFLILISQLSCSRAMERVLDLQDHGIDDYSGYTGPILKIPSP